MNELGEVRKYSYDLVIIHPGAAHGIYGQLGDQLTAVEPPLWCRLIAGYVIDRGFSVQIIDAEAEGKDPAQVAVDVFAYRPRLVCLAVYGHQPSASTQQMYAAGLIAKAIKLMSPALIIMVGGHVSALPERTMKEEAIDFACVGEGPITIVGLLEQLVSNQFDNHFSVTEVPGLVWGPKNKIRVNPSAPLIEDLSQLHGNVWHKLPMSKYRAHNWQCMDGNPRQPYASVYTTLNCPFACSFCCISAPYQSRRYFMRDPKEVVTEILFLNRRYGVKTFKIIDEMFILNERHYTTICKGLIESGVADELNIWAYARVDTVKPETLTMLRQAGFRWLALGIESGSKYVRDGAQKRLKNDDITSVVRAIQAAGINVIGNYIFGLPDDDMESMRATLNLALMLNTEFANFYSAMAYPGSPLYVQAVKEGWDLPPDWRSFSQHNSDCFPMHSQHLKNSAILKFRDEAFQIYFSSSVYQHMIRDKFGQEAVDHINQMLRYKLPRKLIEATYAPQERASAH